MDKKIIKIAWLFPDTLYLHGERGNILALERFAKMADCQTVVDKIDFKTDFKPLDYDIIFCPPGEISSFDAIVKKILPLKDDLVQFIDNGKVLLVTGTSMALFGKDILRTDGTIIPGLDIVKYHTVEKDAVYGDDNYFVAEYNASKMEILASQIQMADFVSDGATPFGKLIYGYGNTGTDKKEGFVMKNSIFTNCLGPVLVTNPWLTVEIIKLITGEVIYYDAHIEKASFETKKKLTMTKATKLTNCER